MAEALLEEYAHLRAALAGYPASGSHDLHTDRLRSGAPGARNSPVVLGDASGGGSAGRLDRPLLRKRCRSELAGTEATTHQLMSWLGHLSLDEAELYIREANRKQISAERNETGKVENVMKLFLKKTNNHLNLLDW
jgi:hypothetical protein